MVAGIAIAIAVAVAAYGALVSPGAALLFENVTYVLLGPVVTGTVLMCIPKTRPLAGGMLTGLAVIWVGVAVCVTATFLGPFVLV